jgi:hypothetical protein
MSRYSPACAGLVTEEKVAGAPGRLALPGLRTVLGTGREMAVRLAGLAATVALFAATPGLMAVRGLVTVLGAVALGLAVVRFAVVRPLMVAFRAVVVLAPAGFAGLLRAAVFFGAVLPVGAATGLAADIVFAAAVSALAATVMDLVAAFMAARAVDIVLADDVAFVAAVVILVAAEVTFAAADETVRAAVAGVLAAALTVVGLAAVRALGLLVTRRVVPLLRVRARAVFAEPRRTGLRAVDCRGIDVPP